MATIRIIVTLKPGILDAAGQAVQQGLHALGYEAVSNVRIGRYLEVTMPDGQTPQETNEMCERFLANPLIEEWRFDVSPPRNTRVSRGSGGDARGAKPEARDIH